ncbi:acetolactate decarboxylase [Lacipirellula sp.]|uniref:acetolactate decarboxylase n=1 Tax=Lacipirellula sp. TaxID=2691419 RepID=UPI003D0F0340
MKSAIRVAAVALLLPAAGCLESEPLGVSMRGRAHDGDELVQFSLLSALAAGDYAGGAPLQQVLQFGDFGVGTFDRLDGEMIVLDGDIFQVKADGTVVPRDGVGATPFATVTFFEADGQLDGIAAKSLTELDHQLDRRVPNAKRPVAFKVTGEFAELTLRSAPPQKPPYRPLAEVIDQQQVWTRRSVKGTLIGMRCPEWMGTLNVAGYHWHFLSDDRTIGGHVLDCRVEGAHGAYDECSSLLVRLPESESFDAIDVSGVTDADVDKIERQRGDDATN